MFLWGNFCRINLLVQNLSSDGLRVTGMCLRVVILIGTLYK